MVRALSQLIARRACLWAALGLLATLAFGPPPARGAVTEAWVQRYSNVLSNSIDEAFKVVRDAAGDIIVTGTTDGGTGPDVLTIKYSGTDGAVLWQQRYPMSGYYGVPSVAVDGGDNVVVTGHSTTAKYAATDGALLWEKRYDGPANSDDRATAVAMDSSGNAVVTGSSYNGTNSD